MNKKPLVLLIALTMTLSLALTSCAPKKTTVQIGNLGDKLDGGFTKYKEPVTVNIAFKE